MGKIVYKGHIQYIFCEALHRHLFQLDNGTYWRQLFCESWWRTAYRPKVLLIKSFGCYALNVCDQLIPVERITEVIESEIRVAVKVANEELRYTLMNGQTWVECGGKFYFENVEYPRTLIVNVRGNYYMYTHNTQCIVRRES